MIDMLLDGLPNARLMGLLRLTVAVFVVACLWSLAACGSSNSVAAVHGGDQDTSQIVSSHEVLLVPDLQGGVAGWCLTVVQERVRGCAAPSTWRGPIFTEGCGPTDSSNVVVYALTRSNVPAVSFGGGPRFATHTEPALIGGLRSVVVEVKGSSGTSGTDDESCPNVTPLESGGTPIARQQLVGAPLQATLPGRREWKRPATPAHGLCALNTEGLAGYIAHWGTVTTRLGASRVFGGGFVSCVDSEYFSPEEASMEVAVLLDAERPGKTPSALPGMKMLPGHPGVIEAPGSEGEMVARRISHGWLVVEEGGTGIEEPLTLLEHLRATIDL